ncbi:unnamed protein product [Adineta ricciae]|uniref:Rieske domain-containing protein n=1 Tax=Adineta ricciae TaxID=249248 RepID=A0A815M520_ADIRI|nr:unnamed protein product [Adineta ricciae]
MATNNNSLNHNMNDVSLYAESKLTRHQAICEITNVVLRSNIKPRVVKSILELLQKLLPSDNTLPITIDDLFSAIISSENNWRVTQYLVRHRHLLSVSTTNASSAFVQQEQVSNIATQPSTNQNNDLYCDAYDRLQACLRSILEKNHEDREVSASDDCNDGLLVDENEDKESIANNKLCCFEMNGYDLLNGEVKDRFSVFYKNTLIFVTLNNKYTKHVNPTISKLFKPYSKGCSLFQFQKFHTSKKNMETIKSIISTVTGGASETNTSTASNEQIRHQLCKVDDLQNGQMKEFEVKTSFVNTSVLLIKQDDKFHAYSSKCCHYKLPLAKGVLVNNRLRCFAHGACFRVDTGDIEDHPGHGNLPKYGVEIVDGQVILVGTKQDLEKLERSKIPDDLEIEDKPVVAIIGAGAGGFTCADMLRQNGFRGRILLYTREGTLPYDRVQLSKQPMKKSQDLLLRDQNHFKKAKIDLILDTEITNINWDAKTLTYHTIGKQMKSEQYDYLVLATGLRSRKLPPSIRGGDLRSIFYVRSMEDANNLVNKVKSPETKNIVIIGDSFIALELCGWLTTGLAGPDGKQTDVDKKNVSVVMLLKAPMIRIFGEKIARALQNVHEKNGAKFYPEANVTEITGENNSVKFVQLETGESIPCDMVIVAIGSETCTELYKDSPIALSEDHFIKVNDRLETSVEHVLAVGDISKHPLKVFNLDEVNCQHWQMACSSGHQAADTILHHYLGQNKGGARPLKTDYYTVPIYWTTQNNKTTIRYAGYTRDPENVVIHGDLDGEFKFVAYYIVDGFVRAVAQSKYDPLSSEVAEVFYHRRNIRKEDVENDMYGYRKYLDFKTKKPE